jgi:mannose-6-phosphate isomerase-like protein (cupin superfamily)
MDGKINISEKLATFSEYWSPRTVAQLNDYDVMVVKVKDEFVWHKHDETDDFFLVLKGNLNIQLRDRAISLGPGEMYIVPKGVEHRPVAREEVHILLIEPRGTPNTSDRMTAAPRGRRSGSPAADGTSRLHIPRLRSLRRGGTRVPAPVQEPLHLGNKFDHPKPGLLQHTPGADVLRPGEGPDLMEFQSVIRNISAGAHQLGRVAATPGRRM